MKDKQESKSKRGSTMRQTIIDAALALFAQKGYASTSICDIAKAAGLDQSSLYYWFSNKEAIIKYILESNQSSMRVAAQLGSYPNDKPLQLYAVLYADMLMLCDIAFDYYDLEAVAFEQRESFAQFFLDYQTLFALVCKIIEEGIASGDFRQTNAAAATTAALALNEGLQHRFRRQNIVSDVDKRPGSNTEQSAYEYADLAARTTLGALLTKHDVSTLKVEAQKRHWL